MKNRTVVVQRLDGPEVGRDDTDAEGVYRVDAVPPPGQETVAIANKKKIGRHKVCKQATSEPMQFFPPP